MEEVGKDEEFEEQAENSEIEAMEILKAEEVQKEEAGISRTSLRGLKMLKGNIEIDNIVIDYDTDCWRLP